MLAFLARRKDPTVPNTDPETTQPDILMRFLTHGGAEVHVLRDRLAVRCQGCDHDRPSHASIGYARGFANEHAATCRAMPRPTA